MTDAEDTRRPEYGAFAPPSQPGFAPSAPHAGAAGSGGPLPAAVPSTSTPADGRGRAIAALVFAIAGAVVGIGIGWGFPLSLVGLVLGLRARRRGRPWRVLGTWVIALAVVSGIASLAWLGYSVVYLLG